MDLEKLGFDEESVLSVGKYTQQVFP